VFVFWRVAICVNEQVLVAVVRGLKRHTGVDAYEPTGRHVDSLWRLTDVQRERAGEDDKRLLLNRMSVAASRRPGLVAPDIPAHVREARAVAQLGDVPRWLARLVGTRAPLELVWTNHVVGHSTSVELVPARAPYVSPVPGEPDEGVGPVSGRWLSRAELCSSA